ncbi:MULTISPECIES: cytochrome b561 [Enterobacteriaceae]|uniref:cytochrome b561 n=1 Tax=Enterobacteriaceae TaxID=543 RepID=UPI0015DCE7D9|nr:cytochrome b561 [Klebsiella sp. WP8-S18-ESBL-06]BBT70811.1 cytochrome b [Klebsiella sp. WP8-S18-ESBL-06]
MKRTFAKSQILMHWLVLILIIIAYAAMELKGFAPKGSPARATIALIHYTAGLSVLLLMLVRVVLKITHRDPEITPTPPRWQIAASKSVHGLLYLMFLALPLLGMASLYFGQVAWSFFGIALPVAEVPNQDIQHNLKEWHELIANAGYFLIGLHALAALFHHYIMRDNTLLRMLPISSHKK